MGLMKASEFNNCPATDIVSSKDKATRSSPGMSFWKQSLGGSLVTVKFPVVDFTALSPCNRFLYLRLTGGWGTKGKAAWEIGFTRYCVSQVMSLGCSDG